MAKRAAGRWVAVGGALALGAAAATPGAAQLRPLEPVAWEAFDEGRSWLITAGVGVHAGQRASLAGTEGTLWELGNFQATWRTGRVALEAAGTVRRSLRERSRFAEPFGGPRADDGPRRTDSGDYRLLTTVLLTPPEESHTALALRFGTRLPTTDNRVGLDRDQTDFFGLAAGRLVRRHLTLAAETGVGIYGTRVPTFEQSDLLIYAMSGTLGAGRLQPSLSLLGQRDLSAGSQLRGTEDLAELRAGLRLGDTRRWVQLHALTGLARFSPRHGLLLSAGTAL